MPCVKACAEQSTTCISGGRLVLRSAMGTAQNATYPFEVILGRREEGDFER